MFYLTTHSTHFIYGYMASDRHTHTRVCVCVCISKADITIDKNVLSAS